MNLMVKGIGKTIVALIAMVPVCAWAISHAPAIKVELSAATVAPVLLFLIALYQAAAYVIQRHFNSLLTGCVAFTNGVVLAGLGGLLGGNAVLLAWLIGLATLALLGRQVFSAQVTAGNTRLLQVLQWLTGLQLAVAIVLPLPAGGEMVESWLLIASLMLAVFCAVHAIDASAAAKTMAIAFFAQFLTVVVYVLSPFSHLGQYLLMDGSGWLIANHTPAYWSIFATMLLANWLVLVAQLFRQQARDAETQRLLGELRDFEHDLLVDRLTGLPNQRALDADLKAELQRGRRHKQHLTLLMIEADFHERFAALYGQVLASDTLSRVALTLRGHLLRPGDKLYRSNDATFYALLPDTSKQGAYTVASRLQQAIGDIRIPNANSPFRYITVSMGVAVAKLSHAEAELLMVSAERAMQRAIIKGRNLVEVVDTSESVVVHIGDYLQRVGRE